MSEEIIKILDDLGNRMGIAIDWSSQNVLPYLQDLMRRFIAYKNAEAIIAIIMMIICIAICVFIIKKAVDWKKSDEFNTDRWNDDDFNFWLIVSFSAIFMLCIAIVVICNLVGIFQNIYMPELTIINYLKSLNY